MIETILTIFALQIIPNFLPSFQSINLLVQKKLKLDLQDSSHLGFLIEMILAVFDLQVTPILPIKFPVNWRFDSG